MTESEFVAIAYEREKHEPGYLRLLEKTFGPERAGKRARVLRSIHDEMPERDRLPLRHVILDGDRVIASMGYLPADFWIKDEIVPVRFTHDLLVDTDYRGKGLAKVIVENATRFGDFMPGGLWMTDPCYRLHQKWGFDDVHPMTTHTFVFDPGAFAARQGMGLLKGSASRAALSLSRSRSIGKAKKRLQQYAGSVKDVDQFDPALDEAWMKMAGSYQITRVRNAAYLNWKYVSHPNLSYRIVILEGNEGPDGYLIWRLPAEGETERRAVVVDFLVRNGDDTSFETLLSEVLIQASRENLEVLSALTTQEWAQRSLQSFGFFPRARKQTWVVAGWRDRIPESWLRSHEPWHICMGDSDGDIWSGC